jgi:hypothetical protein
MNDQGNAGTTGAPLDWFEHPAAWPGARVPGPRTAPEDAPLAEGPPDSPLARTLRARARTRAAMPLDVVRFVAACPACGQDCEWLQERRDTRVRSTLSCSCQSSNDQLTC